MNRIMKSSLALCVAVCGICIPALSFAQAPEYKSLRVLQFNIWGNGNVLGGTESICSIVEQTYPDVMLFQELHDQWRIDTIVDHFKAKGVYYEGVYLNNGSTAIMSKFPIERNMTAADMGIESGAFAKANITIHGQRFAFYSVHLSYYYMGCYRVRGFDGQVYDETGSGYGGYLQLPAPVTDVAALHTFNNQSPRHAEMIALMADIAKEEAKGTTVILGGDFNEPSHLDWGEDTKDLYDHNGVVIEWPSSKLLTDAGFQDAYRTLYTNPVTHPGFTCVAGNKDAATSTMTWTHSVDDRERIDIIYFDGKVDAEQTADVILRDSTIYGPKADFYKGAVTVIPTADNIIETIGVFPSDHKATLATFDVKVKPLSGVESININIKGNVAVPTDFALFGHAQVPNALWTTSTVDESTERLDALKAYHGGTFVNTGASVTIRGGDSYGYVPNDGFPVIQRGWVDGATLSFECIPYAQYAVVVYFNSDLGSGWNNYLSPVKVIDHDKETQKYYTYKSGVLSETINFIDEMWGVVPHATSTSEEGKNYIVIPGLSASDLTLETFHVGKDSPFTLGSISAIQIIKEASASLFINRSVTVTPEKQLLARGIYTGEKDGQLHYGIAYSTSKNALHTDYTHKTLGALPSDTPALRHLFDKNVSMNEPLYYRWFTYAEGANASTYTYTAESEAYTPLQEGIVLYLNGESTENLVVGDIGVTARGGITPVHTWQTGERGAAYHFNQGNWYLDAAQPACIKSSDFTLALWIKKEASDSLTYRTYFGTLSYDDDSVAGFLMREGGTLTGGQWGSGSRFDHMFCKEELGGPWQHLVVVGNRTDNIISLYSDGFLLGKLPMKATPPTAEESYIADGMSLLFGHSGAVTTYLSNSYQDEIILWDRALTATDVQRLLADHQGILDTSLTHRIATADRNAWKLQARYPNQDGLTYGVCYGATDVGATLNGWGNTQEIGTIVDSTLTWTSTFANTQSMVYRWFVKEGDKLIFSTPYTLEAQAPALALDSIKSGLVLYLDGNDTTNQITPSPITVTLKNSTTPVYKSVKDNRDFASSAYYFNRGNWLIDVGQPDCVNTGDFTLGAWINEQDAVVYGGSLFGTQAWGSAGGEGLGFSMHHLYHAYNGSHTLSYGWGDGSGTRTEIVNYESTTNKWQYVTITVKRSTNELLTYLNGELYSTQLFNKTIAAGAPVGATPYIDTVAGLNLLFGGSGQNDDYVSHALIDEIALWDRPLTAEEITAFAQTYQGELLIPITPMPYSVNSGLYWQFNATYEVPSVTYGICYGTTDGGATLDGWAVSKDIGVVNNDNKLVYPSDIPISDATVYRWYVKVGGEVIFSEACAVTLVPETELLNGLELYLDGTSTVNQITHGTPITTIGEPVYQSIQDNRTVASSAYAFNSGDWHINAGKPTCVNTGDFTLSAWVNEQAPVVNGGSFFGTQSWGSDGGSYTLGFSVHHYYDGGESFTASWGDGPRHAFINYDNKGTDIWQYITITVKRSTNELITYVNGESYAIKMLNPNMPAGADIGSTPYIADGMNLLIGGSGQKDTYMCHALLDEIALWNRTLTPEEIRAVYSQYNGEINTAVVDFGETVQLTDTIKADIAKKAKAQFPSLTKITISQENAEKAYLLNVIPAFTADVANASHIIATLECQFLVSELRIEKEGEKDVVIATATVTVTTGSLGDGDINGTLKLLAAETLTSGFVAATATTEGQPALTLKADFDVNTPFYKMKVVGNAP